MAIAEAAERVRVFRKWVTVLFLVSVRRANRAVHGTTMPDRPVFDNAVDF
jgi:hypothetical protein